MEKGGGLTNRQLERQRRRPMTLEAWMEVCESHPSAGEALQGQACLCDGAWPDALSSTIHWRAWRAIHAGRTDDLSRLFVEIADRALAFRATLTPELHVWRPDVAACVPRHWRDASPEVDALVRELEAHEGVGIAV